jgi:PAS domain-containing protein
MTMQDHLPLKHAFIIQTLGSEGSEARERADRVLHSIIEPSCKATGYEAVRADDSHTRTIAEPIISALNTHPLVVADLASPPWDPNVLMDVGFRLATGRPIVLLADTDPKSAILPLHLRNVRIHLVDPAKPASAAVDDLVESIKKYGTEVYAWESDYPTIEFSISWRCAEGGRFIFANEKAARIYGLSHPDEVIGRPLSELDPRLRDFIPDEHYYAEYENDQLAMLGKLMKRSADPKTATVPLWFTKHLVAAENDKIYWPLLAQYRYAPGDQNADIVMRVIFIDVTEWDAMKPRPRNPPQVLRLPKLFKEVPRATAPTHDVFLSYNSRDIGYVDELYQMLVRCGLKVWFDVNEFGGANGLASDLIEASNSSRIFACVLGRNGLGPWQRQNEARVQLLNFVRGQKPVLLLLLPEVGPGDPAWKGCLNDHELETVLEDRVRLALPAVDELRNVMNVTRAPTVPERLLRLMIQLLRSQEAQP